MALLESNQIPNNAVPLAPLNPERKQKLKHKAALKKWFAIIVEYCVVVRVLYIDFPDKSDSGERANRGPLFAVEVMAPD